MKQATRSARPANPAYRLLHETIEEALGQLDSAQPIPDENIHAARKALKRARAALKLLRDGMSNAAYRMENSGLRDAGRILSPIRDARSLVDAFDSLHDRYSNELQGVELAPLQKILHSNLTKARRHLHLDLPAKSAELKRCIRLLEDSLVLAKREDFLSIDSAVIGSGLQRIYRTGRKAFAEAKAARTTEALHEYRKQVKYLFNSIDGLTSSEDGRTPKKILKRADRLGDRLGDDHELAVLSVEISRATYTPVDSAAIRILHELIERRRVKLEKSAFKLGKKLYEQKAGKFRKGLMKRMPLPSSAPSSSSPQ
ncbi:CHAD domain-containing protein [Nitrosovibrio tenuis]|uniref:CHAD domain-containing protein n=1 Tax=Nitrosovibrio tenuis TaxID=1233 RepID=A0A1H7K5H0_9PROT|nr:CHAD domain-containing protein [Nitrosovibrio tenuis]SEK82123.1 CHAD domain-containing protein [Nitrosovibrio tenuis]